ncbi:RagB/SusD family nutrient uptake outer membrane protein [Rapidithrix thailandica]|uniref:RagB/SusD family nutrient uptake outer membrane protein n=1 Tax=Rapidithrix thailandica TaxID=413964 RepID=A0AAW9SGY8_9BACT
MKIYNYKILTLIIGLALSFNACNLELEPADAISFDKMFSDEEGARAATLGNYSYLKDPYYIKYLMQMGEFPGDNVSLSGTTTDHLFYAYNYQHFPGMGNTTGFWRKSYQTIYGANQVIENIENGVSDELDQLKGENYFIRAMVHFDLVRLFGRPYAQDGGASLGVMIKDNTDVEDIPGRSTVKEVYDFVEGDLLRAVDLMGSSKSNAYASKEVAYALLARLYLYKEDNAKAIEYADKVINSGRYELVSTSNLPGYYRLDPEENSETIFAIKHIAVDDREWGSIGSMYYHGDGAGWGEMYASQTIRELLIPEDQRNSFIEPQYQYDEDDNIIVDDEGNPVLYERGGYPKYYINKFSYQDDIVTLSSPVILRLAEMYLTRAEANAKLGNDQEAIDDVNLIRERAGLTGANLYTVGDLKGHASVLDVVLEERRMELMFEAHRPFDVYRNNRTMNRDYPGTHLNGDGLKSISPDHPRVIYFIPEEEIGLNDKMKQNPT